MDRSWRLAIVSIAWLIGPLASPARATWDPSVLNVSWSGDFAGIVGNEINAKTDSRLGVKAQGDGVTDDTPALRAAIALASSSGGGVVYLPTGDYALSTPSNSPSGSPLQIPSHVILRGDGSALTRLFVTNNNAGAEVDWIGTWGGISLLGSSQAGLTDLAITGINPSSSECALVWNRGSSGTTDVFLNNVALTQNNSKSLWIEQTTNMLVQTSTISISALDYGPILIINNTNVTIRGNAFRYNFGRPHMQFTNGGLITSNSFIRDAMGRSANLGNAIESGGLELTFSENVQVLGNYFQTLNRDTNETLDGESVMTQHSTFADMQDFGSITAVTANTLTDANALWGPNFQAYMVNPFPTNIIAIASGNGVGQWRTITSMNTVTKTVTLDSPWNPVPDVGSLFTVTRWGGVNLQIKNNTFVDNPHGVVLFDGVLNSTVDGNIFHNSEGVMLRAADFPFTAIWGGTSESRRAHMVAFHTTISNNQIFNTEGVQPNYILIDVEAFSPDYRGMTMYDIQTFGNTVSADPSNPNATYRDPAQYQYPTQDGLYPCYFFGPASPKDPVTVAIQASGFENNVETLPITYNAHNIPFADQSCVSTTGVPSPPPPVVPPPVVPPPVVPPPVVPPPVVPPPMPPVTPTIAATASAGVRVYPNPWKATRNPQKMVFDQLPPNSTVKLFTISGHRVKTLTASGSSLIWDLTDSSGRRVSSGIYLFLVTDNQGGRTRGKVSVIF